MLFDSDSTIEESKIIVHRFDATTFFFYIPTFSHIYLTGYFFNLFPSLSSHSMVFLHVAFFTTDQHIAVTYFIFTETTESICHEMRPFIDIIIFSIYIFIYLYLCNNLEFQWAREKSPRNTDFSLNFITRQFPYISFFLSFPVVLSFFLILYSD